jgi:hypothetical protein
VLFKGKRIRSWGGPGKGTAEIDGSLWVPYQLATFPTPPFPDYVSGHSTFSAAASRTLALWTGSDRFGNSVTLPVGNSKIEPGLTPAQPVILKWETFTDAANEAGMSRRYGLPFHMIGRVWEFSQQRANFQEAQESKIVQSLGNIPVMSQPIRTVKCHEARGKVFFDCHVNGRFNTQYVPDPATKHGGLICLS